MGVGSRDRGWARCNTSMPPRAIGWSLAQIDSRVSLESGDRRCRVHYQRRLSVYSAFVPYVHVRKRIELRVMAVNRALRKLLNYNALLLTFGC